MGLLRKLRSVFNYPLNVILAKGITKSKYELLKVKDRFFDTYSDKPSPIIKTSFIKITDLDLSELNHEAALYLTERFLNHEFDLLGSGWIRNSYSSASPGLEGFKYSTTFNFRIDREGVWLNHLLSSVHLASATKIIRRIDGEYVPIDWQKDYKSGYRWSQKRWYGEQPIGHLPGVDIKMPWELSRMQHLVQLAVFAILLKEKRSEILRECHNQILDFIATNPPRMGANWVCTMDVAIRAANLLTAYDILKQLDDRNLFDDDFSQIFSNSIYEHGSHVINNLEYSPVLTTNHYLANISGLVFIAAYLESSHETDFWLAFSFQEIISEFRKQFHADGVNFESSTSYHCLSVELVTYASAIILGISHDRKEKAVSRNYTRFSMTYPFLRREGEEYNINDPSFFPSWYIERLYRSGKFISDITKPNGDISQFGDNDSGKFLRFLPTGRFLSGSEASHRYVNLSHYSQPGYEVKLHWDENNLNHRDIESAVYSLFDDDATLGYEVTKFENTIIQSMCKGRRLRFTYKSDNPLYRDTKFQIPSVMITERSKIEFFSSVTGKLRCSLYDQSGYCVFKTADFFLIISYAGVGQNGIGGHSHNDKLSFELTVGEQHYAFDPGSYIYTPLPQKRNYYRGTAVHNTMVTEEEQNDFYQEDLFRVKNESVCELLELSENKALFSLKYKNVNQYRRFTISDTALLIEDFSNVRFTTTLNNFTYYSNGYGKLLKKTS
jgi:hypothetical protein